VLNLSVLVVFVAPSADSCPGVLAPVFSAAGSATTDDSSVLGAGVAGAGTFFSVASPVLLAVAFIASSALVFFCPAFAAASAPACLIAMLSGVSFFSLELLSLSSGFASDLDLEFSGSEMEMCRVSEAVRAEDDEAAD